MRAQAGRLEASKENDAAILVVPSPEREAMNIIAREPPGAVNRAAVRQTFVRSVLRSCIGESPILITLHNLAISL